MFMMPDGHKNDLDYYRVSEKERLISAEGEPYSSKLHIIQVSDVLFLVVNYCIIAPSFSLRPAPVLILLLLRYLSVLLIRLMSVLLFKVSCKIQKWITAKLLFYLRMVYVYVHLFNVRFTITN